jgi:dephospho-CoA kinase
MIRLGLTGGIGSGKSTVAGMLESLGAGLVDADAISRSLTAPGGAAIEPIRQAFGEDFVAADGALDRARMRELAYRDPDARKRLESIIHPLVGQQTAQDMAKFEGSGCRLVVHDIPLLAETGRSRAALDWILVVDCPPELQVRRVTQRSGLSEDQVLAIIAAQSSRLARLRVADVVICNTGGMEELRSLVNSLHARLIDS